MLKTQNPLIFVVEDNHIYKELVVSYLKSHKFTNVESFLSGEEALKHMDKKPEIFVQDYLLDGMTGIEVLIKVKKINPKVEFIFLSGNDNIDIAINTMKYGANNYIVKDQMALKKLVDLIEKISSTIEYVETKKKLQTGMALFLIGLGILIIITLLLAIKFPGLFGR